MPAAEKAEPATDQISNPSSPAAHRALTPDTQLRRTEVASALTEEGFPTSPATLATMAVRGDGPPYELWGNRSIYKWGASLEWARRRMAASRMRLAGEA